MTPPRGYDADSVIEESMPNCWREVSYKYHPHRQLASTVGLQNGRYATLHAQVTTQPEVAHRLHPRLTPVPGTPLQRPWSTSLTDRLGQGSSRSGVPGAGPTTDGGRRRVSGTGRRGVGGVFATVQLLNRVVVLSTQTGVKQ